MPRAQQALVETKTDHGLLWVLMAWPARRRGGGWSGDKSSQYFSLSVVINCTREANGCLLECLDVRIRHKLLNPALGAGVERGLMRQIDW